LISPRGRVTILTVTEEGENMRRIVVLVAACAAAAIVVASPASAATPRYALSGVETGIPQPVGGDESTSPFAGTALSFTAGFATWSAHVTHHSLDACASLGNSCITGGTFSVSGTRTISGTFTGGSISSVSGSAATCTSKAVYAVNGVVAVAGGGTATFSVRLTHYQVEFLGTCVPYFATVSGTFG
jgi:hypothetical protein